MKWPLSICWTSPYTENGNRHFQVKSYGGKDSKKWLEVFPTKNNKILFRISFKELYSKLARSWISFPKEID
tara:strand:- start:783 stop:995 length:213 start_codon:yes stop_codon:yes gene_type:complete